MNIYATYSAEPRHTTEGHPYTAFEYWTDVDGAVEVCGVSKSTFLRRINDLFNDASMMEDDGMVCCVGFDRKRLYRIEDILFHRPHIRNGGEGHRILKKIRDEEERFEDAQKRHEKKIDSLNRELEKLGFDKQFTDADHRKMLELVDSHGPAIHTGLPFD